MMVKSNIIYTVFPRIVRARSINFTVCVMRGLFEGAVYSESANYLRKYNYYILYIRHNILKTMVV